MKIPAIRFDVGAICQPEKGDDGSLRIHLRFRKVGPLQYMNRDGKIHTEHVTKSNLFQQDSIRTAALKLITENHPAEGMITPKNSRKYQRGMTGNLIYPADPYAVIVGAVTDAELQDAILSGRKTQVSSGYWSRLNDAAEQTAVRYNHFAAVERGRAGPDVGFLLNSDALECLQSFPDICCQVLSNQDSHELFGTPLVFNMSPLTFDDAPKVDSPSSDPKPTQDKPMPTTLSRQIKIDDAKTITVGDGDGEKLLADHLEAKIAELASSNKLLADALSKADELAAKVDAVEAEAAKETARADKAEKELADGAASEEALKKAREDGYNRRVLEDSAHKLLPAEIKIDSTWTDRQICEAVLFQKLGINADSEKAGKYKAMADAAFEGAYQVLVVDADSVQQPAVPKADGGMGSGRFGNKPQNGQKEEMVPNHKKPLRMSLGK